MSITIYHNPKCSTSRKVLELIRAAGHEPEVIEYLQTGWTRAQLKKLLAAMRIPARELLRTKGTDAEALGLVKPGVSDDALLDAMVAHPVLVNRPIVVTPRGARLARPVETVQELL